MSPGFIFFADAAFLFLGDPLASCLRRAASDLVGQGRGPVAHEPVAAGVAENLLERVVVAGLQPGTSASVRIECIAMRPGAPVFETWRLGIKATEQGVAPSRAKRFWVAATVEVEVE